MAVTLSGNWQYEESNGKKNIISLPGTINEIGAGDAITKDTVWYAGLHNPFWWEREEFKSGTGEDFHVPFLSQPKTHYTGVISYSRNFSVNTEDDYYLHIELTKWKVEVFFDDKFFGADESLCAPFVFGPVHLSEGEHKIEVRVDNSMQHPYRPDAHGISSALNADWNGMGGRIELLGAIEQKAFEEAKKQYAKEHPVNVSVQGRNIVINGKAKYMRGTHFGGDFPLTGIPSTDREYWEKLISTVREWGFNFIRCHSYCPPEIAFRVADEQGMFLQIECGMWNVFQPGDEDIFQVLMKETRKILEAFGQHPSFVMLSPSNEPGGKWYRVLERWVSEAKEINKELGYEGRRIFTAQSGWYYDVPPSEVKGTDYLYFHRSAFGPIHGGMIRNKWGWNGRDYSPSLTGCTLPVISHEMGQWCAYPDFDVIDGFTGYARPGNFEIFKECARENDVLRYNKDFVYCSGRNQVRLLKEEFEADYRTPEITGYEYLDLHDYTGQGTALVGVLDPLWNNKGYIYPKEFKTFNSEIVILTRIQNYVIKNTEELKTTIEICNFSGADLKNTRLVWRLAKDNDADSLADGVIDSKEIINGENSLIGEISVSLSKVRSSQRATLYMELQNTAGKMLSHNSWTLSIFAEEKSPEGSSFVTCRTIEEAEAELLAGKDVLFVPYLSDLDLDCPDLSMRNVFWNAQMGPRWVRQLGIVVDDMHPLFKYFPTEKSGGWEWDDILNLARGLNFPAKYSSIVRVIDDWNRNFPLSMMFEGKVLNGKIFFVAADLTGGFEKRPAADALRNAIIKYVGSSDFDPKEVIEIEDIKRHLKPLYKGADIIREIKVNGEVLENSINCNDINPNIPFVVRDVSFPTELDVYLKKAVTCTGLYVLPVQNDRDFPGIIREYDICDGNGTVLVSGEWKNGFTTQKSPEFRQYTDHLKLRIKSTYSMGEATRWKEGERGYFLQKEVEPLMFTIAVLGIDYAEDVPFRRNDEVFWSGSAQSRHKEIDI